MRRVFPVYVFRLGIRLTYWPQSGEHINRACASGGRRSVQAGNVNQAVSVEYGTNTPPATPTITRKTTCWKRRGRFSFFYFCFSLCFFALEVYTSHVLGLLMPSGSSRSSSVPHSPSPPSPRSSSCQKRKFSTQVSGQVSRQVKCLNDGNELPVAKTRQLGQEYLCMLIVFIRQIN